MSQSSIQHGWGILIRARNKLDGYTEHLMYENTKPVIFKTRREAQIFAKERFGYVKNRPDLKAEPHGWLPPKVLKVELEFRVANEV